MGLEDSSGILREDESSHYDKWHHNHFPVTAACD